MAALYVFKGPNEGEVIPIDLDLFTIGRSSSCDLHMQWSAANRRHAQIVRVGGEYRIEDMRSRNQTFVNNQVVEAPTVLKFNDRIRICEFVATFLDTDCFAAFNAPLDRWVRTQDVLSLARAAIEEQPQPLHHLDPARLAVLSDALEEAGCTDSAILEHFRSPGPHFRECRALGLVLGQA